MATSTVISGAGGMPMDAKCDFLPGEDVIIMLRGKNSSNKRVSKLPQNMKFKKILFSRDVL
jgi:hypothetical protein